MSRAPRNQFATPLVRRGIFSRRGARLLAQPPVLDAQPPPATAGVELVAQRRLGLEHRPQRRVRRGEQRIG